jgi:hypothetical protein
LLPCLFVLAGCGGSAPEPAELTTPTRLVQALLSDSAHFSAQVALPAELTQSRLATGATTGYKDLPIGDNVFELKNADSPEKEVLLSSTVTLGSATNFKSYRARTVVVYGMIRTTEGLTPQVFIAQDPNKLTLSEGEAALRVLHLASNLGSVNLYQGDTPIIGGQRVPFQNPTDYIALVPSTDTDLNLRSDADGTNLVESALKGYRLLAGKSYTLILFGKSGKKLDATLLLDG